MNGRTTTTMIFTLKKMRTMWTSKVTRTMSTNTEKGREIPYRVTTLVRRREEQLRKPFYISTMKLTQARSLLVPLHSPVQSGSLS